MPVTTTGYLPTFYLIVSVPLHLVTGLQSFIVSRAWIAIVNFLVLIIGFHYLFQSRLNRSSALIALLILSPFPLYFMASINPSGLAYSLTFLLAVILLKGFTEPVARNWKLITILLTLTFLTVRRDSIVWVGVIGIAIIPFPPVRNFLQGLPKGNGQRKRNSLRVIPLVFASLAIAYFSSQYARGFLKNAQDLDLNQIRAGLGNIYPVLLQLLGDYGWLSERMPNEIYALFTSILLLIFALVIILGAEPFRRAFVLIICGAFCLLLFGSALRPGYLQGRYFFRVALGVVCASYALTNRFDQLSKQASARLFGLELLRFQFFTSCHFSSSKTFLRWIVILIPECDLESSWLAATANLCLFMYLCFGLLLVFNSLRNFKKSPL